MAERDPILDEWDEHIYGISRDELHSFTPGTSARRVAIQNNDEKDCKPYIEDGDENYAEKYLKEELKTALLTADLSEEFKKFRLASRGNGMEDIEEDSGLYGEEWHDSIVNVSAAIKKKADAAYNNFDFSQPNRSSLAIDSKKDEILSLLRKESAIVVKGFTGCGKSTQVPQFVLDDHYQRKVPCNIVVTQPRRIAAITIAQRVSTERVWPIGTVVGYQVAMDKQANKDFTCLTYMTTGCLLAILVARKSLTEYTHIIIDEVHERDEDTDLLLMIVRKFLRQTKCNTKIVLMSATADATKFSKYFETPVNRIFHPAPIVEVVEAPRHHVNEYYLDDLQKVACLELQIPFNPNEVPDPYIKSDYYEVATRVIAALDEKREITRTGRHSMFNWLSMDRAAVLVFLPGLGEIISMHKNLSQYEDKQRQLKKPVFWNILPLHSTITSEEQSKVFMPPKPGYEHHRKIILATNIAESSLTVPDTIYVIDFCLHKQLMTDSETNFCSLKMAWAPKSSCVQRKGRVGRVRDGVVYRMVWKNFYETHLPADVTPEILRCPLEQAILKTKVLDLGEPKALLSLVIDPPRLDNILTSITTLKEVGALYTTVNGKPTPFDGDLSYLGRIMSKLPLDVHLSKLIMLGYVFNVLEECIIMAAGLASKSIFTSIYQEKLKAYQVKMIWSEASFSDPMTILNAYKEWKEKQRTEYFKRSGFSEKANEKRWASEFNIQLRAIKEMDQNVTEYTRRLKDEGIEAISGANVRQLTDSQKELVLRVAIFGAFYPNYFSRSMAFNPNQVERDAVNCLNGLDPYTTVRLAGFPPYQPAKAYMCQVKENLADIFALLEEDTWDAHISVDDRRIFVQFHQEGNPEQKKRLTSTRVCLPVYLAVKQAKLNKPFVIRLMDAHAAEEYVRHIERYGKQLTKSFSEAASNSSGRIGPRDVPFVIQIPPARFPEMHESLLRVVVSHIEEPYKFWCQRSDEYSKKQYSYMEELSGPEGCRLLRFDVRNQVRKGQLVMAPFAVDSSSRPEYYRAKVLSVRYTDPRAPQNWLLHVYFIDFGNAGKVYVKDLKVVPEEFLLFAPMAFECRLKGVGPKLIRDLQGKWVNEAKAWFEDQALNRPMEAKIYSVVSGVTALDLKHPQGTWENSITIQFVAMGYADPVEESYCSRMDNDERIRIKDVADRTGRPPGKSVIGQQLEKQRATPTELLAMENTPPLMESRMQKCNLKGPFSPLEMKVYGKVKILQGKPIKVEDDSVNSVLLDDQPGDPHERLLVAASVLTNQMGDKVVVRGTTLMPNIHGLPSLLALLFAPRAEFRSDEKRTRLIGAICGLGYDAQRDQSICPDHDMEIAFDKEIDNEDILRINKIRYWLNSVMGAQAYFGSHQAPSKERMREVSGKVLQLLFELVSRPRKDVEFIQSSLNKWNTVRSDQLIRADTINSEHETLIPLHNTIKLLDKK